jgi:hypothetical protein
MEALRRGSVVTTAAGRRWLWTAYAYGVVVALGLGYFVARNPLQFYDCFGNMLHVQSNGLWSVLVEDFTAKQFLRPFLLAQIDVTFDLANGHYFGMYKTIEVLQLVAAAVLFVHLLRVRSMAGAFAVPLGIAMLFGSHTIAGAIHEAFPINTYLTIVVCCLIAANLSFGPPALWRDAAAVALFLFAALTVESGLLIWVILATAWIVGCRGVSRPAVVATTAALVGYFVLRFAVLDVGVPSLEVRSSGFGFRVLDTPELVARFGQHPWIFYAYNVVCQLLTVLFAEPKGGVWVLTRGIVSGELLPRDVIGLVSSTGTTLLIAWYSVSRMGEWRQRRFDRGDRLVLIFVAVLCANAVIGYGYTKDVIVSPAGVFHAAAGSIAFTHVLSRFERLTSVTVPAAAIAAVLVLVSAGWASRLVALHYNLHQKAVIVRNDWMLNGPRPSGFGLESNPVGAALARQLYDQAVSMRVAGTYFYPAAEQAWKYFEKPW